MKRAALRAGLLLAGLCLASSAARAGIADGSCLETWELVNFQPASPNFGKAVRSSSYRERATVILLISGGSAYCLAQASAMEAMRAEMEAQGPPIRVIAINIVGGGNLVASLANACTFDCLQDVPLVNAWAVMGGGKDDIFTTARAGGWRPGATTPPRARGARTFPRRRAARTSAEPSSLPSPWVPENPAPAILPPPAPGGPAISTATVS